MNEDNKSLLRQRLSELFNVEELKDLCFDIGIEHENLSASTKDALARELIVAAIRLDRLELLLKACQRVRPNIKWWRFIDQFPYPRTSTVPVYLPQDQSKSQQRSNSEKAITCLNQICNSTNVVSTFVMINEENGQRKESDWLIQNLQTLNFYRRLMKILLITAAATFVISLILVVNNFSYTGWVVVLGVGIGFGGLICYYFVSAVPTYLKLECSICGTIWLTRMSRQQYLDILSDSLPK
jgi:hypothetical protein